MEQWENVLNLNYSDFGYDNNLLRRATLKQHLSGTEMDAQFDMYAIILGKIQGGGIVDEAFDDDGMDGSYIVDLSITEAALEDGAVTTAKLADLAVDTEKLANLAVEAAKLAGSSVTSNKIANLAVGAAAIANAAVGTIHIGTGVVQTAHIADGNILTAKIGDLQVNNAKIANLAINNAKINDLSADKVNAGTLTGRTVQSTSSTTGAKIRLNAGSHQMECLYNDVVKGYVFVDSSGNMIIDADETVWIRADGAGDDVFLEAADTLWAEANWILLDASGNVDVRCDEWRVAYNEDNDGSDCYWWSNSSLKMKLTSGGNLEIAGTLSKGGGSFRIDHPQKPRTHILNHSFTESPEQLNIYKGRAKTKNKKCIVKLPSYFGALNKEIEYALTPIKTLAKLAISKEVKDNRFEVISDEDCEFSWVVYGVRKDKFALAHPIIVEEKKEEEGYIHPELFGDGKERSCADKELDKKGITPEKIDMRERNRAKHEAREAVRLAEEQITVI